ncbi:hypothetical protein JOC93_000811 [Priestia taiwanensis]|uniref:Group-specific protein n=1 Tax=Priestia taiwanensis TaxID=1347902 RepID=A0A917AM92_9BACI|nr:hypothetical protein [Priestia taiwanensis]GGE60078.1 hypothetical protein GCM10007140_08090 [Priestia taiwanensis]
MREKRVRGMKRKTNKLIEAHTVEFPVEFYNGYWHLHLPIAQEFINSTKTPMKIKRLCMQTLIDRAKYLIQIKPNEKETYRVVAAINLANLWNSQIIIFKGDTYFKDFFCRDDEYQKWLRLSSD